MRFRCSLTLSTSAQQRVIQDPGLWPGSLSSNRNAMRCGIDAGSLRNGLKSQDHCVIALLCRGIE
jgi:hypothetical protein